MPDEVQSEFAKKRATGGGRFRGRHVAQVAKKLFGRPIAIGFFPRYETGRGLPAAPGTHSSAARSQWPASAAALGEASHQSNPVPTLRRRVLAKRATAMVRGLKILLTFGYAENAFNHNGGFDPGVKLLSMIATSLLVSSAGC
jgi:hypothetical protein